MGVGASFLTFHPQLLHVGLQIRRLQPHGEGPEDQEAHHQELAAVPLNVAAQVK